jgi:hypothetical protein
VRKPMSGRLNGHRGCRRLSLTTAIMTVLLLCVSGISFADTIGGYNVQGLILTEYDSLGGPSSFLGYPTSSEAPTACGGGRYNNFQGGIIQWVPPLSSAHEVHGSIHTEWVAMDYECGPLGFPVTDQEPTACGGGQYNNFQGGIIEWTPTLAAHEIQGAIHSDWVASGYECGPLGFPITDEAPTACGGGRYNNFQGGIDEWTPTTGAHYIFGNIYSQWLAQGYECGALGFPVTDPYPCSSSVGTANCQEFQNGMILTDAGYNRAQAVNYASQWTDNVPGSTLHNTNYWYFSGDDCTNFVTQALSNGGIPDNLPPGAVANPANDFYFWNYDAVQEYASGGARSNGYSASAVDDLYNYLFGFSTMGTMDGSFSYNNGTVRAPSYVPSPMEVGDVLFYNWGGGEGISHASLISGTGTDTEGFVGTLVDAHSNNQKDQFWTLKDVPGNTNWQTTTVYFAHINK